MAAQAKKDDKRLSKRLAWLLRHGLHEEGLSDCLRPDGYVPVSRVLPKLPRGADVARLRHIVETNDKQRFSLDTVDGALHVRANQGHTIPGVADDALLVPLLTAPPTVVHGTYRAAWPAIQKDGLSRMKRLHVHFATEVDPTRCVSGMRSTFAARICRGQVAAPPRLRRGYSLETRRGDAAAAWMFRGDESRRRRSRDVEILWRRVAAPPRPLRGYSVEASRGDAAAATTVTWIFRGDESRRRRGGDVEFRPRPARA